MGTLGRFWTLTRKEVSAILLSPPILFATAFFVLLDSFAFYLTTVTATVPVAVFDDIALFILFTSIIMFPLISMHSFSEDNAGGTLETLLTAPISNFSAVMAKYAGAMIFVFIYLSHGIVYALLLSYGGNLDWNATLTAFLALAMVGSLAMSLGVFVSALTVSPAAAAAGTGGILIFLTLAADFDPYSGPIADVLNSFSFIPHSKRWIAGELDTRGLIYFVSVTALFLFYAWLSIGSRGSFKRGSNQTVRRRLTISYILVAAGFILLLGQAAILHIKGFWETGTPVGPALARIPTSWLIPLGLSLISFGWSFFTYRAARRAERSISKTTRYITISEKQVMKAPRYYYEDNIRGRRRVYIAAIAAVIIVLNLNWLSRYPFRTFSDNGVLGFFTVFQGRNWDVTGDGRNSLSATTRRTLGSLQGRVQVYSFLSDSISVHGVTVADDMRRLLERYSDYNALVSVTFADALREPEMAGRLAINVDARTEGLENLMVVDYQGRRIVISAASLVAPPDWRAQMAGESKWVFDGENRLTQAIMNIVDPRTPNVFFTYGHLEHSLEAGMRPEHSASRLAKALMGANMRVRQHNISPSNPIPPECEVLVVASPRVVLDDFITGEIRRYLNNGGRLLVFAPVANKEYDADEDPLNELLFSIGGGYRNDLALDQKNNDNGEFLAPLGRIKGSGDGQPNFVFSATRTIRDNPRAPENGWTCERMLESHPTAVSESFSDASTRPGPFTLLYRSVKSTNNREARVAVVASGRMAADSDIIRGANEALLLGITQWLTGREEPLDIAPRVWINRRIILTGPQMRAVLWIGIVALPLAWLCAGISVWWLRRD